MPVDLAARLRSTGRFSEVAACSLKTTPGLAETLRCVPGDPVYLVPLLMAEGYTYRTVLPRLLAESETPARRIVQCRPVGVGPGLETVAVAQAMEECAARNFKPGETALVLAAHGTERDSASGDAAHDMANRIAATQEFRNARAAFLEQTPRIETVLQSIAPRPCVVVGYFMDYGAHGAEDIPNCIASAHPAAAYTGPIGVRPEMAEIVLDIVQTEMSRES